MAIVFDPINKYIKITSGTSISALGIELSSQTCRTCGVELTEQNWFPSCEKNYDYICKVCSVHAHAPSNMRYYQKPEAKQHQREYFKEYCQRPEVKQRRREQDRQYKTIHRERLRERNLKRSRLRRQKVLEKLGGKCVYCGCDNPEALEINHINGNGLSEYRTRGCYHIHKEILNGTYPHPVELTCRVCNAVHYLKMKGITGFKVVFNADSI